MARLVYIAGGARSGKSSFAQKRAEEHAGKLLYVATAGIRDAEMAARVQKHRSERGERWQVLEEPLALARKLPTAAEGFSAVLVDCLTLWLTNLVEEFGEDEEAVFRETDRLLEALSRVDAVIYVVSNEVGSGMVPDNRLARMFRDLAGELNRKFAEAADEAWLTVSGLPLQLK